MFTSVLDYAISCYDSNEAARANTLYNFANQVISSNSATLQELVDLVSRNRITLILSRILQDEFNRTPSSPSAKSNFNVLAQLLDSNLADSRNLQQKRDLVIKKLSDLLTSSAIDHIFFKTFNRHGGVGVDVDILIRKEDYLKCIGVIMKGGFVPIDSLSKTYATGFLLAGGNNPIIVDLHTDISILGVSYFSPNTMFANKIQSSIILTEKEDESADRRPTSQEAQTLNVLNDRTSAAIAMSHAVIKESSIRASELLEVYEAIQYDRRGFSNCVRAEHLTVANDMFMLVFQHVLSSKENEGRFVAEEMESSNQSLPERMGMSFLAKSLETDTISIPLRIPTQSSLVAFFECVRERRALGTSLRKAIPSFWFGRNLARAGQKLTAFLGD